MGQPAGDAAAPEALQTQRFVWPPRPLPSDPPPAPTPLSIPEPTPSSSIDRPLPAAGPAGPAPFAGHRSGLWPLIEEVWLGRTVPPLPARAAAAGWAPDPTDAFCPRCGTTVGSYEADEAGCRACREKKLPWDRFLRVGSYEGLLRQMIVEVKFTRWRRLGHELGLLLGERVLHTLAAARIDPRNALLIPMPTTFRRRLSRGIDHALVITRGVSQSSGIPVCRALDRLHRPTQRSMAPSRRRANVAGSFRLRPGSSLAGRTLIVIDDVRTTGATMAAACRAIRTGGRPEGNEPPTRVWAAVLGVTPEPGAGRSPGSPAAPSSQARKRPTDEAKTASG